LQFGALATTDKERIAAFAAFADKGLPTRRDEAWHYTDLRAAMREAQAPAPAPDAARIAAARAALGVRAPWAGARFVLVDGHFVDELSDPAPAGVKRALLVGWPTSEIADPAVLLNAAFAPRSGLMVNVEAGAKVERPMQIAHFASGQGAVYSHMSLAAFEGASATIIETFVGAESSCQRNARVFVTVGDGAQVEVVTEVSDPVAIHVETQEVLVGRDASFRAFGLIAGGELVRRQIFARQLAPGAKIALSGLSLIDRQRHADTTLTVRHAAPHGWSREFFRHIVADEGEGVYQGKVIVDQHAQKTDGGMKSQALLLSPHAQMNNKPELEIFADDVVCGHGATVGALDPEQLFYLQARGVPKAEAEAMLLEAFGAEAIERVADAEVAAALVERLQAWLKGRAS
jgi:Fe-S cluster assembly protein SufD